MTHTSIKIRHADYSGVPFFASVMQKAFAGASVLPNGDVMHACLRAGGKKMRDVQVELIGDREGIWSAYQIDGQWGECVLIDATDGEVVIYEPGQEDTEDAASEVVARWLGQFAG